MEEIGRLFSSVCEGMKENFASRLKWKKFNWKAFFFRVTGGDKNISCRFLLLNERRKTTTNDKK